MNGSLASGRQLYLTPSRAVTSLRCQPRLLFTAVQPAPWLWTESKFSTANNITRQSPLSRLFRLEKSRCRRGCLHSILEPSRNMPGKSYCCTSTVDSLVLDNQTLMSLIAHARIPSAFARHPVLLQQLLLTFKLLSIL